MAQLKLFILSCLFVLIAFSLHINTSAASSFPFVYGLCNVAKYANSTPFQYNLNKLLAALGKASTSSSYGLLGYGKGEDKIRGVFQCRGDQPKSECHACVEEVEKNEFVKTCPDAIGSQVQLDQCYVRYENYTLLPPDYTLNSILCNVNNDTSKAFEEAVDAMTSSVIGDAPHRPNYFSTASTSIKGGTRIYAAAQCIGYTNEKQCSYCLSKLAGLREICNNAVGAQIHYDTCFCRYEEYPFYISS